MPTLVVDVRAESTMKCVEECQRYDVDESLKS